MLEATDRELADYAEGEIVGSDLGLRAVVKAVVEAMARQAADKDLFRTTLRDLAFTKLRLDGDREQNEMFIAGRKYAAIDAIDELLSLRS
ncbi:hypothetical protein SAMN06265338_101309 [Rhodoblastus acidophilus]|uniref:Uncharacterized protein n=1 Tax=Rhodoblastus acidophilus TaxID=1074 RepID=A0A212Q098_RHOAC|nr:hypothetical protein [Rhodoblastus acidophilus]PPQ38795.1 hypothetical protein CKO16_09305 [Rhodoblastus acidophilus]RAI20449.1 hypothetical protein CH337_09535 [Rhodoblastus acidophilus]SNB52742.1 hypothetical protein SAMN06265338_101309 [Rhodoblastus acidophilus]